MMIEADEKGIFICISCQEKIREEDRVFRKLKSSSSTKEDWCWACIKKEDKKRSKEENCDRPPKYFLEPEEWKQYGYRAFYKHSSNGENK